MTPARFPNRRGPWAGEEEATSPAPTAAEGSRRVDLTRASHYVTVSAGDGRPVRLAGPLPTHEAAAALMPAARAELAKGNPFVDLYTFEVEAAGDQPHPKPGRMNRRLGLEPSCWTPGFTRWIGGAA